MPRRDTLRGRPNLGHDPGARVQIQDDILDNLGKRIFTGGTEQENNARSRVDFPGLRGDARILSGHHASGAETATDRFGLPASQVGGGLIEMLESAFGSNQSAFGRRDTVVDLLTNALGGATSVVPKFARGPVEAIGSEGINRFSEMMNKSNVDPIDALPESLQGIMSKLLGATDR